MRKTKILVSVLATVLVLVSLVALGMISSAETALPSIDYCTLVTKESVYIRYYVPAGTPDGTKILIWTSPEADGNYTTETADDEITDISGQKTEKGILYNTFDYKKLASRQMGDFIYARAYDGENYSKLNKYSILTYAYNTLGKTTTTTPNQELADLLNDMLRYGASSQKYYKYKTDRLVTSDFYQISVKGEGKIESDLSTFELGLTGDEVKLTAPLKNTEGFDFLYWVNSAGEKVNENSSFAVTIGTANETYTPVYDVYSLGLEFEADGEENCILIGMGTCEDKDVIIPAKSSDGKNVVEIDRNVFANKDITSITIPTTVTTIGRNAFNGCASLAKVYFEGTTAEWQEITIADGNDALTSAELVCLADSITPDTPDTPNTPAEKFTVTFVDHDGTEISKVTVDSGAAATAPADPERDGYTFIGWDKDFSNVTSDITVTATYRENVGNKIYVTSIEELKNIPLDGEIYLSNDIDFTGVTDFWSPIGTLEAPFTGTFDGQGYTIKGFKVRTDNVEHEYLGLFGYNKGTIKNLNIDSADIRATKAAKTGDYYVGALVGYNAGEVINCSASGTVSAKITNNNIMAGGLVGFVADGAVVSRSYSSVAVVAETSSTSSIAPYAGGLVGKNEGNIDNCYATGSVSAKGANHANAGGLVGHIQKGNVTNSYASGNVSAGAPNQVRSGGLVGYFYGGVVENCFAVGNVTATDATSVYTNTAGPLVGSVMMVTSVTITNSYNSTSQVITGSTNTTIQGTAKTDAELKSAAFQKDTLNFSDTIWTITDGELPTLK